MPKEVGTTNCLTCTHLLRRYAIAPEDHALLIQCEYCDEDCTNQHPWVENCRTCAKVRADQLLAARLQDAAGLGPEKPPTFNVQLEPDWYEKVCDLIWGKAKHSKQGL